MENAKVLDSIDALKYHLYSNGVQGGQPFLYAQEADTPVMLVAWFDAIEVYQNGLNSPMYHDQSEPVWGSLFRTCRFADQWEDNSFGLATDEPKPPFLLIDPTSDYVEKSIGDATRNELNSHFAALGVTFAADGCAYCDGTRVQIKDAEIFMEDKNTSPVLVIYRNSKVIRCDLSYMSKSEFEDFEHKAIRSLKVYQRILA